MVTWHNLVPRPQGSDRDTFRRLGLITLYRHETCPDDSLFEDVKWFEYAIVRMRMKQIPEDKITTLGQDPKIDRLEWRRQWFEMQTSKKTKGADKGD